MRNSVTYPILRHMLGYIDDLRIHHKCDLMILGIQVRLLISWHEYVQYTVYDIWCHECSSITYPILRHMLRYTDD